MNRLRKATVGAALTASALLSMLGGVAHADDTYPPPTTTTSTTPPPPTHTASTGSDVGFPVAAGGVLLVTGVVAAGIARKRSGKRAG